MSVGAHLLDTCAVQRPDAQPDGYGEADPARGQGWQAVAEAVRCRLVVKEQRVGDGAFAERPVVTTYTLLVGPGADVRPGDRITAVRQPGELVASAAVYRIESVLRRRSRHAHHVSCRLERLG